MSKPILFQCIVINNQDPLMLGRVRARLRIDNYEDIIKGMEDWNEQTDPWTAKDPFIFNPLLPYFIYQVPEINEIIQVLYVNREFKYQNQYYVQSNFYSPNAVFSQFNVGGDKFTGTGMQLKSPRNIKNKNTGAYENQGEKGLYPEPGDNAILGRGNADLIVQRETVLLRAGKYRATPQSNVTFVGNNKRAFLQLSQFEKVKKQLPPKKVVSSNIAVFQVKYLVEWVITNPENTQDKFCGAVYLYQLKLDPINRITNSDNLKISTVIPENLKTLVVQESFTSLGLQDTINFINSFIKACNSGTRTVTGRTLFSQNQDKFPIYFRPSNLTYDFINPAANLSNFQSVPNPLCPPGTAAAIQQNIQGIFDGVKLNSYDSPGFGLIWKQNTVGVPITTKITEVEENFYVTDFTTIGAMGAEKLFLLSHSTKNDRPPINFDGTLYGISGETFYEQIIPATSSMVRGEELMELINLIVRYLVTHTHAFPGLPPVPVTQDGTTIENILTELQSAATKILNDNIRLN